jgi:hypothetical protein
MLETTLKNVPGMRAAAPVPVLEAGSLNEKDFLADYVWNSRPCVIQGAVRHWAALSKWRDKDYLKSRSGQRDVYFYPYEYHISAEKMASRRMTMPFAEAVDRLHAPETGTAIVATAAPQELLSDLGRVSFLTSAQPAISYPPARYFFYRGAGTTWHYHPFDESLMCQVVGVKQIGLLSTATTFEPEIRKIFFREHYYQDASAFAELANADLPFQIATLEEGDALYIPPLWWHGIQPQGGGFGATATVTWRSPLHVDASAIRRLAAGEVHMIGGADPSYLPHLRDVARRTGLERQLETAWAQHMQGA